MKKILFFVITVILFGTMAFAQDKQDKQKPQTQQKQQTKKSTQSAQSKKQTQSQPSTQPKQTTQNTQSTQAAEKTRTPKTTPTAPTAPTTPITPTTSTTSTTSTTPTTPQTEQTLPAQPIQSTEKKAPSCQPIPPALLEGVVTAETNLGRIYIARDFVHADLDYKKGNYNISLVEKDGGYWFKIFNNKKELLFAELAVVKPYEGKAKRTKMRVRKEFLKDYEYFRVTVTKPESHIMLYFMIKQKEVPAAAPTPSPAEKPEELKVEEIEM